MTRNLIGTLLALCGAITHAQAALPSTDTRAVPTYESAGLYWSNPGATAATGCEVKYRRNGDTAWQSGLAMWFDARSNECRGSLVHLTENSDYQVELNLPGLAASRALSFRTWPNQRPVARTVTVAGGSATLDITQGGSPTGYVVYQAAPGAVLDAMNASPYNVSVNASYVIVRGFVLKGAQQDGIRISPNVTDVIIEDNEITGWGRQRSGIYGVEHDSAVHAQCSSPTLERVTVQRNEIHDPRYTANSWSDGHPEGPQAVTISYCGGNHVIRHNEMFNTTGKHFNDIIGGADNHSTTGFPNADSDIYGNDLSQAWDDAIEAEGGNRNVRIWGNYIDQTGTGIASTVTSVGPLYMFRNVYNRSRMLEKSSLDSDDRQVMFKAGSDASLGDGRRYVFHNTMLQATQAGATYGLGAAGGISGTGSSQLVNNTVSRNNIFHNWRTWTAYYDIGVGNDFANDLFNGSAGAPVVGGITGTPIYAAGGGWQSEGNGQYQLATNSPGYDKGARIANFNDAYTGAAPDVGAHEASTGAMRFGIAASPGPAASGASVAPTPTPTAVPASTASAAEKSFLTHYYTAILGRSPDAGGSAFWEAEIARMRALGANANEAWYMIATTFLNSAEYTAFGRNDSAFLTDLYNTFFNRAPDSGGLQYWAGLLAAGLPRDVALVSFMFSPEFASFTQAQFGNTPVRPEVDTVGDFYRGLLSRLPDDSGFTYWVQQFRTAECQGSAAVNAQAEAISSSFMNGVEYVNRGRSHSQFVGDLYNAFLRRGGDLAGVQHWIAQIASGAQTRDEVRRAFVQSPEFQQRVAAMVAQGCS